MNRWICFIVRWYRSIRYGANIDGHDWVEEEVDVPALVTISKCEICGEYDVSWKRQYWRAE
jgi:hypothetical protein